MRALTVQHFTYYRSKVRSNTFDIADEFKNHKSAFKFLTFNEPREDYLINRRVKTVMQSFEKNQKILHTGLISFGINLYYGDNLRTGKKKDFLIVIYDVEIDKIDLFVFENKNPKNKEKFAAKFIIENLINR